MSSPAAVLALIAACSRDLGYLEALTEAETVKADEIVEQLQAALELAGKVEGVAK